MRKTGNKSAFGIEYYQMPDTSIITQRPRTTKFTTYKFKHFIEEYTKSREFVPGPKYDTIPDWKENLKARGAFPKTDRITFTEGIMKEGKRNDQPGPGAYDSAKIVGKVKKDERGSVAKSEKICAFIEEASFQGN